MRLEGWARDGLTDEQIASNIGIGMTTFYRWLNDFEQIREAIKKGKGPVDIQVENALLKRALGYDYEEVTTEIYSDGKRHVKKVTKHVPPEVGAIAFWLKNRRRGKWCDRPPEIDQTETAESDGFIEALTATAAEDWADEG